MFNYFSVGEDVKTSIAFAEKFPNYASPALNSITYGYGRGEDVTADYSKAIESKNKSIALHDGPNIFDTMAEIEFELGNYQNALDNQLKALDFAAGGGSPYWTGVVKYWHHNNKEEVISNLIKNQNKLQTAITEGDKEAVLSLMDGNNPMYTGDSNLEGFYEFDISKLGDDGNVKWKVLELYDFSSQFSDIFEDFFGEGFGGSRRSRRSNNRGSDLRYDLSISLEEAFSGKKQDIKFSTSEKCGTCSGSGSKPGHQAGACSMCGGHGQVRSSQGFFTVQQTCPQCAGSGEQISSPCSSCNGQGKKQASKRLSVSIPKGVDDGLSLIHI